MMCILPPPVAWRFFRAAKTALGDQQPRASGQQFICESGGCPDTDYLKPDCSPSSTLSRSTAAAASAKAEEAVRRADGGDEAVIHWLTTALPLRSSEAKDCEQHLRGALRFLELLHSSRSSTAIGALSRGRAAIGLLIGQDTVPKLLQSMPALDGEAGNIAVHVLDAFLQAAEAVGLRDATTKHLAMHASSVLEALLPGFACPSAAAHCGASLRALAGAHGEVTAALLKAGAA